MIINFLQSLIGTVPYYYNSAQQSGYNEHYYDIIQYIIAGMILIMLVSLVYRLLVAVFGRWVR